MSTSKKERRESPRDRVRVRELDGDVGARGSRYAVGLRKDYGINTVQDGQCLDIKIGGIVWNMLIDSGVQCNIIDGETWCKNRGIIYESSKYIDKNVYPYGHDTALKLLGQFRCNVEV